jgi:maltooligosyltrehalose trehalohydrolase
MFKLDHSERARNQEKVRLHCDLLRLRRDEPVFSRQNRQFDGAVLSSEAFVLRFFAEEVDGGDRLLVVNLGRDLKLSPMPEPLLAPPVNCEWQIQWSSEHPSYGGSGTAPLESELNWILPGHAAVVLRPRAAARGSAKL